MYPEKLPQSEIYRYHNEDQFYEGRAMIRGFVEADYNKGMHIQEFWEINIVMGEEGRHYIGEHSMPVKRGDVFIIPPDMPHGYVGKPGFDVFHVLINNLFMEKYRADLQTLPSFFVLFTAEPIMRTSGAEPLHLTLSEEQFVRIEAFLREIERYSMPNAEANLIVCNSFTLILITKLCELYTENVRATQRIADPEDRAFMTALAQIHERYYEKISISQLAKTAQLSRSAFIRKFQEICRMPPAQYLVKRRIEAAEHMLLNSVLSVAEIAEKTGFYDASHLMKSFRTETGMTPSQYRKERIAVLRQNG